MIAELVVKGILAHLAADWLLQNDWMATNKGSLLHPAAWVHGALHFILLALVFPPPVALALALSHVLIDTRVPLRWWARVWGKSTAGPLAGERAMWEDQVLHFILIAAAAWMVVR